VHRNDGWPYGLRYVGHPPLSPARGAAIAAVATLVIGVGACRNGGAALTTVAAEAGAIAATDPGEAPMTDRDAGTAVSPTARRRAPTPREELGRALFSDASLSVPPGTSCASCHDPRRAFSGNHGSTCGVAAGSRPGHFARRNTPSVLYMKYVPAFHFALADDDDANESPYGGLSWSGRADSVAEFVRLPLFDSDEMNNGTEEVLASKLRRGPYAAALATEFPHALETAHGAAQALGEALQAYLTSDAMAPFSSKFDDYLRGTAKLSETEMRGLVAFKTTEKGACNHCHRVTATSKRSDRSLFTDFGYDAVAVPRNRAIPANADPAYHDLGLCERKQTHAPTSASQWCGSFRTPSLRNVAVRERFMHNGAFTKLRDVVAFYATRAVAPQRWYPNGDTFDDVPPAYRSNVNVTSLPYNRPEGAKPPLDDQDIDAIVAFLETLTDAQFVDPPKPLPAPLLDDAPATDTK
jgi:cytochrome c peroxidase